MISVIVPVYNVKDYVIKCLESLKNQTLKDIEVIVVDDGSTDGSREIVDSFCKDLDHFHVFHKENGGLMSAWTYGVRQSIGDYIGFVDSDDFVSQNMYEVMYNTALEHDADIVMCNYQVIENGKAVDGKSSSPLKEGLYVGDEMRIIRRYSLPTPGEFNISMARWNKIFRREMFLENMKYCECLSKTFEDRYIVPACLFSANSFYYIPQKMNFYVIRKGSNSGMYKKQLLEDIQRMYRIQGQMLEDKGLMEEYKELYEKAYMDYIHLYISRNVVNVKKFADKYDSAKNLLKDELTRQRLNSYGHLLPGKVGACLRMAYKLRCPFILAFGSCFA